MAAAPTVGIVGLRALNRDLKKMSTDRSGPIVAALQAAGRAAAEPVAAATRGALPQSDRPDAAPGRLAGDVRVTASRTGAAVRMGRASVRYAGWVEFGGTRRNPYPSRRDFNPRGRYLFPAAVQLAARSAQIYSEHLAAGFANYPWSNTGTDPKGVHD